MFKCLFLLVFSFSMFSAELVAINKDLKDAKLIVLGEVVSKDEDTYLIKLDKWASKTHKKTNFIKLKSQKELIKFKKYLFSLNEVKDSDQFVVTSPERQVYEIKTMGEYDFIIRDYNSDKPMVGQIGLNNTLDYIRKNLDLTITTRSITKFERDQVKLVKQNSRRIASVDLGTEVEVSKLSEGWILSFFALLTLIPFILRKTKF